VVLLLGGDRKQSSILSRYCAGLLASPMLKREIVRQTNEVIEFRNSSSSEITTNDQRTVRGRSAIAVLGSDVCYWQTAEHSASSDEEVVSAALPSLSMCPDGGLLALWSSVHTKKGFAYRKYKQCFGVDDADDFVWYAPSAVMNPLLPQSVVDKALAEDAPRAKAEYLSEWRTERFYPGRCDRNCDRLWHPRASADASNQVRRLLRRGQCTGGDSFTLAIAHKGAPCLIDVVREVKRKRCSDRT
jgi:hypothetical protein